MSDQTKNAPMPKSPKSKLRHRLAIALIIIILIILSLPFTFILLIQLLPNEAKTEAAPIEKALLAKGVQKKCEEGDSGRGWDNRSPNYTMRLQFNMNKQDTIAVLDDVLQKQGFTLSSEGETAEGSNSWYVDETSKQNPYKNLERGPLTVSIGVFGPPRGTLGCLFGGQNLKIDDTHTGVMLSIGLPDRL